jgi:hypothetical protein
MIGKSAVSKYPENPNKYCCELEAVPAEKMPYAPMRVPSKTESKPTANRIFGGCFGGPSLP